MPACASMTGSERDARDKRGHEECLLERANNHAMQPLPLPGDADEFGDQPVAAGFVHIRIFEQQAIDFLQTLAQRMAPVLTGHGLRDVTVEFI